MSAYIVEHETATYTNVHEFPTLAAALDHMMVPQHRRAEAEHTLARCNAWIGEVSNGSRGVAWFVETLYPAAYYRARQAA